MTAPEVTAPKTTAEQREARAEETLRRIFAGGDLGAEATALSNDFTDEYTGRLRAGLRRMFRRPGRQR
ncbi:hypothetical protein B7R54_07970 [Subtercola boreus]|uniref:Uncharacterized protein n=1 Tax=Subtercola boreus TaxID=120213 RepID=A0A3E0VI74_9MICO|nr:hypothetical protein B7R54_07970 [Subtercola boreus]